MLCTPHLYVFNNSISVCFKHTHAQIHTCAYTCQALQMRLRTVLSTASRVVRTGAQAAQPDARHPSSADAYLSGHVASAEGLTTIVKEGGYA